MGWFAFAGAFSSCSGQGDGFHLVTYFGSQYLEGEPHTVGGALDERIPFHPGWIYIYSSWFVLLLGVPALLNIVAPELCLKYWLAHSIDQLLSNIIYLIYPTTFEQPRNRRRRG